MSAPDDNDRDDLIERVLLGTPDRLIEAGFGASPAVRDVVDGSREALAQLALTLEPVAPSPSLRARLAAAVAAAPRTAPRRAVAVLDMIQDYLTPGRPLYVPRAPAIVPAVAEQIARARRNGDPVIYLCDHHEADDPELKSWPSHAVEGTDGWKVVPELAPLADDLVIKHRTYSAFFGTRLDEALRERGVDTLVITGCATELGILATATDAMMRGYRVEVPPEAQAGSNEVAESLALGVIRVMRPLDSATGR